MNGAGDFQRRALLRGAGAAMLLPALAGAWPAALAARPVRFQPPGGPMRFSRTLTRSLATGHTLRVSRTFTARFDRVGDGFRVEGSQTGVEVNAPAGLEMLASMERERVETGVFPLELSRTGMIRAAAGDAAGRTPLTAKALSLATERATGGGLSAADEATAVAFLRNLAANPEQMIAQLPAQLFAPQGREIVAIHDVPMENGETGRLELRFSGTCDPPTGLMQHATRSLVTILAGQTRETVEDFALHPA